MQFRIDNRALTLCLLAFALSISLCAALYGRARAAIARLRSAVRGENKFDDRRAARYEINLMMRVAVAFCAILLAVAGCVGYMASLPLWYARKRGGTR